MEEVNKEEANYFRIFRSPGDFNNGATTPTGDTVSPGNIQYLSRLARTNSRFKYTSSFTQRNLDQKYDGQGIIIAVVEGIRAYGV